MAGFAAGAAALALLTAGCSGASAVSHDHGTVVGYLDIPFAPAHVRGRTEVVPVTVHTAERFSVLVQTSDGPYAWGQTGRPDPGLVRLAGDFDRGALLHRADDWYRTAGGGDGALLTRALLAAMSDGDDADLVDAKEEASLAGDL